MYKLEEYKPTEKRRAILAHTPGGIRQWTPIGWVDYDDVPREEADECANAMLQGLLASAPDATADEPRSEGPKSRRIVGPGLELVGNIEGSPPSDRRDLEDGRRWSASSPDNIGGRADEIVRVEVEVNYPDGLLGKPMFRVSRWWPDDGAVLDDSGDRFSSGHGQYRLSREREATVGMAFNFLCDLLDGAAGRYAVARRRGDQ